MKFLTVVQTLFAQRPYNLADRLIMIVQEVARMDGFRFDQFLYYLDIYQTTRIAVLSRKPNGNEEIETLQDCCDTIRICLDGFHCKSIDLLCFELEELFAPQQSLAA